MQILGTEPLLAGWTLSRGGGPGAVCGLPTGQGFPLPQRVMAERGAGALNPAWLCGHNSHRNLDSTFIDLLFRHALAPRRMGGRLSELGLTQCRAIQQVLTEISLLGPQFQRDMIFTTSFDN